MLLLFHLSKKGKWCHVGDQIDVLQCTKKSSVTVTPTSNRIINLACDTSVGLILLTHSATWLPTCLAEHPLFPPQWYNAAGLSTHASADDGCLPCLPLHPSTCKTIVSFQFVSHRFVSCRTLTEGGLTVSTYTLVINSYLLLSPELSVGARWPVFLPLLCFFCFLLCTSAI